MHPNLIDFITEKVNLENERHYISWEFFYYYKHKLMQCELIRELHHYTKEMRELLLKHHVGAPNPLSLEKLFHEFLPSAYKSSRYTPRMSYFHHGDVNGTVYAYSFLIREAKGMDFFMHQSAKESKHEVSKNKVLSSIVDAGQEGISRSQLFRVHSHFSTEQRNQIIQELIASKLIYEKKEKAATMFFLYDQQEEDDRKAKAEVEEFKREYDAEYEREQAAKKAQEASSESIEIEEPTA